MYTYIIGLGNPGEQYKNSRHNLGFMAVDALAEKLDLSWRFEKDFRAEIAMDRERSLVLAKPQTFMNASGEAVGSLIRYYEKDWENGTPAEMLYVCYDDLDIAFGEYKIQFGKHPKIHNGLNSIIQALGTDQFWQVRIGSEGRKPEQRTPGEEYVLRPLSQEDRAVLAPALQGVVQEMYAAVVSPQSSR